MTKCGLSIVAALFVLVVTPSAQAPLPSWSDGAAKAAIVAFVQAVTGSKSKDYVAPGDRIAVFDNGRRLAVLVHHDDAEREFAYDRQSHVGRLDKALDGATANRWIVVSMKSDWNRIFAFEN